jgi:hypothetical protein
MKRNGIVIILFLGILFDVFADSKAIVRYDPRDQEGYFQGWNYSYRDKSTVIFATFLVSNLGPGSLNNGISLYISNPKIGTYYKTKEFASKDLVASKGKFGQKSGENEMGLTGNVYHIKMRLDDLELDLSWDAKKDSSFALTQGEFDLSPFSGFLRADIAFSQALAKGEIRMGDTIIALEGKGGMEHLNTNVEVHKFSKNWEILRAFSTNQNRFYFGGFNGTKNFPDEFFKRVALVSGDGKLVFSDQVEGIEIVNSTKNRFSGYDIPTEQILTLKNRKDCTVKIRDGSILGEINILSNISIVLRFFVRLFFAKPYQLHYKTKVILECPDGIQEFGTGIHSYYLINP